MVPNSFSNNLIFYFFGQKMKIKKTYTKPILITIILRKYDKSSYFPIIFAVFLNLCMFAQTYL